VVNSKAKDDTKILHSNNFKTGTFETLHLEDFHFMSYKRRAIAATNKLAVSGLSKKTS
jgi:hypothetical protein